MSPIRVAVDAHRLLCEPTTSGATYLNTLISEWVTLGNPPDLELLVPFPPPSELTAQDVFSAGCVRFVHPSRIVNPIASFKAQIFWQQYHIPRMLRRSKADVYFSPYHLTPQLPLRLKMVTTIHDLCFVMEPTFSQSSFIQRAQVLSACIRAARLICVSEFTFNTLSRWAPAFARKAVLAHNGMSIPTLTKEQAAQQLQALDPDLLHEKYLMWIGTPSSRKNPKVLFDSFRIHHQQFPQHKFVIVAPQASHERLRQMAGAHGITPSLELFANVDSQTRDSLYRCAIAVVFPSKCEGFGYPVLEAMCQGCLPVSFQNGPAAEIVGDVFPLAGDTSAQAIASLVCRYLSLTDSERESLAARLIQRAQRFSSSAMASATLSILEEAAREAK
jgi:glycosyltransferase involved in cell wall biosynthesis